MKRLLWTLTTLLLFTLAPLRAGEEENIKRYTLSGYVRDAGNGEALIGATIYIKELNSGSVSNIYGFYSVSLPPGTYNFQFSYMGYALQEFKIDLQGNITRNISLNAETRSLDEVIVKAEKANANVARTEMSMNKMEIKTIRKIPALMGEVDVLKAIQLLPGVQATSEGTSNFNVRGGNYDQNLILLDDATVYNASHLMGFFSVFNNDAIKDVKLYKGDIPASSGGRLSSLLDVRMKDGNNQKFTGTGGIGAISSRLTVEGPISKGVSSYIISGRRTYLDVFTPLSPKEEIKDNRLYFYDFNAKLNATLNDNNRLYLSGYFGRDVFKNSFAGMDFGNKTLTARWNHLFSPRIFSNVMFIYSDYDYALEFSGSGASDFIWKYRMKDVGTKIDFTWYPNPSNTVRAGVQSTLHNLDPGTVSQGSSFRYSLPANYSLEHGFYLSNEQELTDRLSARYGIRWSVFQNIGKGIVYNISDDFEVGDSMVYPSGKIFNTYNGLEPRLALRYQLSPLSSIKASYTRTFQYYQIASNASTGTPLDLWFPASPNVKPQRSDQYALGYFRDFDNHKIQTSVEVYYKDMRNTIDFKDHPSLFLNRKLEGELRFGNSQAWGAEFMVQKPEGRLNGWICYTWSRSIRTIPEINEGRSYRAPYEKPHSISLVANYEITQRFSVGGAWVYATGAPETRPTGRVVYGNVIYPLYSGRNQYRLPDYHRLDLSVTLRPKETSKKRLWQGEWNFSVYNAYNRHNTWTNRYMSDENVANKAKALRVFLFTIVPSVTYNFKF
ncbi:MAG: TonB-dependent receptor [Bacteroidales bacterium]